MTTVATRGRAISDLEGFDIIIKDNFGNAVDMKLNGVLGAYEYEKKLKHTKTVADWKRDRFRASYPGYTCDVLLADGSVAPGQKSLRAVRESYDSE